jgi:hypothetical protein
VLGYLCEPNVIKGSTNIEETGRRRVSVSVIWLELLKQPLTGFEDGKESMSQGMHTYSRT